MIYVVDYCVLRLSRVIEASDEASNEPPECGCVVNLLGLNGCSVRHRSTSVMDVHMHAS